MLEWLQKMVDDEGQAAVIRKLGGLLFGIGMFMVFVRKGSDTFGTRWSDFALFLTLGIPVVLLYGMGLNGDRFQPSGKPVGDLAPWRVVFLVFGLLLTPFALFQFIDLLGGTPGADLNLVWVFGLVAAMGMLASRATNATYMTFLAGIAVIVAWTALWDKIVGLGDSLGGYRWLMLLLAVILGLASFALMRRDDDLEKKRSKELASVAGISAVIAGGLSVTDVAGLGAGIFSVPTGAESSLWWEIVLLAVSVKMVIYGSYVGARGASYVGGIGIFIFVLVAGLDLDSGSPEGKLIGWPLLLVVLGVAALVASLRPEQRSRMPDIPRPGAQ